MELLDRLNIAVMALVLAGCFSFPLPFPIPVLGVIWSLVAIAYFVEFIAGVAVAIHAAQKKVA